jgi:hypothetical protein
MKLLLVLILLLASHIGYCQIDSVELKYIDSVKSYIAKLGKDKSITSTSINDTTHDMEKRRFTYSHYTLYWKDNAIVEIIVEAKTSDNNCPVLNIAYHVRDNVIIAVDREIHCDGLHEYGRSYFRNDRSVLTIPKLTDPESYLSWGYHIIKKYSK